MKSTCAYTSLYIYKKIIKNKERYKNQRFSLLTKDRISIDNHKKFMKILLDIIVEFKGYANFLYCLVRILRVNA